VRTFTNLYLLLFGMPHLHSAHARDARAARAAARGYLRRARPGTRFLEVPAELHEKGKIMMKSLDLHRVHSGICGYPTHYARDATLGARCAIGEQAFEGLMKTHRLANSAKHSATHDWRDVCVESPSPCPRSRSSADTPSPLRASTSIGTPGGELIGEVAKSSMMDNALIQRITKAMANLLVRVRTLEVATSCCDTVPIGDAVKETMSEIGQEVLRRSADMMKEMCTAMATPIVTQTSQACLAKAHEMVTGGCSKLRVDFEDRLRTIEAALEELRTPFVDEEACCRSSACPEASITTPELAHVPVSGPAMEIPAAVLGVMARWDDGFGDVEKRFGDSRRSHSRTAIRLALCGLRPARRPGFVAVVEKAIDELERYKPDFNHTDVMYAVLGTPLVSEKAPGTDMVRCFQTIDEVLIRRYDD